MRLGPNQCVIRILIADDHALLSMPGVDAIEAVHRGESLLDQDK